MRKENAGACVRRVGADGAFESVTRAGARRGGGGGVHGAAGCAEYRPRAARWSRPSIAGRPERAASARYIEAVVALGVLRVASATTRRARASSPSMRTRRHDTSSPGALRRSAPGERVACGGWPSSTSRASRCGGMRSSITARFSPVERAPRAARGAARPWLARGRASPPRASGVTVRCVRERAAAADRRRPRTVMSLLPGLAICSSTPVAELQRLPRRRAAAGAASGSRSAAPGLRRARRRARRRPGRGRRAAAGRPRTSCSARASRAASVAGRREHVPRGRPASATGDGRAAAACCGGEGLRISASGRHPVARALHPTSSPHCHLLTAVALCVPLAGFASSGNGARGWARGYARARAPTPAMASGHRRWSSARSSSATSRRSSRCSTRTATACSTTPR